MSLVKNCLRPVQAIIAAGVITLLSVSNAIALMAEEIDRISEKITVSINGINPGSGVIIAREGDLYYVLTANHVVRSPDEYIIITHDGEKYPLDYDRVIRLPGIDLAVLAFSSDRTYPLAQIADYDYDAESRHIFISGWPEFQPRLFTAGLLISQAYKLAFVKEPTTRGYDLFYTNFTQVGMSGGPILDTQGQVIGIHGMSEGQILIDQITGTSNRVTVGYSAGIPVNRFLQSGIPLNLNISDRQPDPPTPRQLQSISAYMQVPPVSDRFSAIDWTNRGNQLYRHERWRDSLEAFERAINIQSNFYPAWYGRANALSSLSQYDEAIASYDRATQLQPNFHPAWRDRGALLMSLGRHEEALQAFDRLLQIQPDDYGIWYLRGNILMNHLDDYPEAARSYARVINIKPDFTPAFTAKAQALFRLGDYGEAIAWLDESLHQNSHQREAWVLRGQIFMAIQRYAQALNAYNRAVNLDSNHSQSWLGKAIAYLRLNRDQEAKDAAQRALEINPGDLEIQQFLQTLP
ncbi:MAG: tetratricopeptide repeat-containing serine protease family protein [Limnospira sp. PMC 1279.21]|uniref:tetratricopeptide repeat-containing S1 family peptidase n=1 Tax=Limnospira TaxID=2596745 RepID=UPI000280439D|nr:MULTISPECIES: tetratricopeptide repeat-containing serine protease family protein [Limnospira]EKD06873.1 TPR repeat-containing protein [Arthrospira platensis C1]QJB26354.1 tetratricopeptide repeat protein [Limnospira fusiformis SAG 85.79]MDT9195576.1 tetratricopeptide repeat-containing serine protease family protein [Limnospira sp. PMC 1245.20]MDT9200807.1 tetratricopeptide repeat-containing serine protease family protein [Limnospira sp. PMC 1042.18]MDT9216144.1 tetratricopeptide repeat-cont